MIAEALAIVGGGGTLIFGVAFVVLAFMNRKDHRELLNVRDLLDAQAKKTTAVEGQLLLEEAAHKGTRDELTKEKYLRAEAESALRSAQQKERDYVIERIKKANVADANGIVADLMAAPLAGSLPPVPEGRATAPGPDRLLSPDEL